MVPHRDVDRVKKTNKHMSKWLTPGPWSMVGAQLLWWLLQACVLSFKHFFSKYSPRVGRGSWVLQRENADANKSLRASSALEAKDASRELAKCSTKNSLVLGLDCWPQHPLHTPLHIRSLKLLRLLSMWPFTNPITHSLWHISYKTDSNTHRAEFL